MTLVLRDLQLKPTWLVETGGTQTTKLESSTVLKIWKFSLSVLWLRYDPARPPPNLRDDVPAGVLAPALKLLLLIWEDLREWTEVGVPKLSEQTDLFNRFDFPVLPNLRLGFPKVLFNPFFFMGLIFEFERWRLLEYMLLLE